MTQPASQATSNPFFSDEYRHDRAAVIARMRRKEPVHYIEPLDAWIVLRHDLVHAMYTHPDATPDYTVYEHARPAPDNSESGFRASANLFSSPPAQHARMRRLVSAAFTPRSVARMEDQVREVIAHFGSALSDRTGTVDLYSEFFEPIPNTVISRIIGIPPKGNDERRFRELGRSTLSLINPFLGDDEYEAALAAVTELHQWILDLANARRRDPRDDLLSDFAGTNEQGDQLTLDEIASVLTSMIAAGTDTTVSAGVFGLYSLFQHPEVLEELRADRSLLPNAVLELLRYDFGPSDWVPRFALRDFELEGHSIRKGQLLMLSFMGADRDPSVFPDPDRLDVRRDTSRLAIFGHGSHYCLGANLARQELCCMLDAVLDFLPTGAKLIEDEIQWSETLSPLFRSLGSFPVAFGDA